MLGRARIAGPALEADLERADALFQENQWDEAAASYERILTQVPDHYVAQLRLAITYRHTGRLRRAAEILERVGKATDYADPNVIRMQATTYVQLGDEERAYQSLERYVAVGLRAEAMKTQDAFAPLRGQARFEQLLAKAEANDRECDSPEARQFDFWIGDWKIVNHPGIGGSTDTIRKTLNGCVLEESYHGYLGNRAKSTSFYNRSHKQWRQTWMTDSGEVLEYAGGFRDGAMVLEGEVERHDGVRVLERMAWKPLGDGRRLQWFESSEDGGQTWSKQSELPYTPVAPTP